MIKKKTIVDVPKKRVKFLNSYVYYITEYYVVNNEKKTNTNKSKSIGKLVDIKDKTKMYPNDNYYEIFELDEIKVPNEISKVGASIALDMISEKLKLKSVLKEVFGDKYKHILQLSYYMLIDSNIMFYLEEYLQDHINIFNISLNSKKLTNIYRLVDEKSKLDFFKLWKDNVLSIEDFVAYDVTSISSSSKGITINEYGHNRDGDNLEQINVGVLYSQNLDLPICYDIYNGSINDKTFFKSMIKLKDAINISKDIVYVMDKGFLSRDNLKYMNEENVKFLISTLPNEKIYRNKMLEHSSDIKSLRNKINLTTSYGLVDDIVVDGVKYFNHIYYDIDKMGLDEKAFFNKINSIEEELNKNVNKEKTVSKSKYFNIVQDKSVIKSFSKNEKAMEEDFKLFGIYSLLTNKEFTPEQALRIYKKRNMVEEHYDNMKNTLDFDSLNTHNDISMQGKFFIGFIAQILLDYIASKLEKIRDKKESISVEKVIKQLDQITLLRYNDTNRLYKPLTSKQKKILSGLGVDLDEFLKKAELN